MSYNIIASSGFCCKPRQIRNEAAVASVLLFGALFLASYIKGIVKTHV